MKWLVILILIATIGTLQACGPKYETQESCNFVQNSYGERVSLKSSAPLVMYVHESVIANLPNAKQVIIDSMKKWNDAAGYELLVLGDVMTGPVRPRQDGLSVIYWLDTWEDGKELEQARTSIYWDGNLIKEADIRVNGSLRKSTQMSLFQFSTNAVATQGAVDFESLMIHELGHVLGLVHYTDGGAVMSPTLAQATLRRELSQTDMDSLRCEY